VTASPRSAESPLRVGLAGVQLVALADADPRQLAVVADRHGVSRRYNEAFALIADDSLDAVVLATPDEHHPPQVRAALSRRLR